MIGLPVIIDLDIVYRIIKVEFKYSDFTLMAYTKHNDRCRTTNIVNIVTNMMIGPGSERIHSLCY